MKMSLIFGASFIKTRQSHIRDAFRMDYFTVLVQSSRMEKFNTKAIIAIITGMEKVCNFKIRLHMKGFLIIIASMVNSLPVKTQRMKYITSTTTWLTTYPKDNNHQFGILCKQAHTILS
jgi:hypothetical protein